MATINYYQNLTDTNDNQTLIKMVNEQVEMFGIPVILRKINETGNVQFDPVYSDYASYKELDKNNMMFDNIHTYCLFEYQRFNQVLNSWGLSLEEGMTLEATMKLEDKPYEDNIVQFLYEMDNKTYSFKIGSANIHRGICYRILLIPYYQDVTTNTVYNLNEPKRENKVKQIDINNFDDNEIIRV